MALACEFATEAFLKNSFNSLSFTDKLSIIQKTGQKELWKIYFANVSIKGTRHSRDISITISFVPFKTFYPNSSLDMDCL